MENKLAILILAAGSANRMGSPKQLLKFEESTLLGHCITNAIASNSDSVFCVLGANSEEIKKSITTFNIEIILNENWQEGIGSSISKGVSHIEKEHSNIESILILLADQPLVKKEYLNDMMQSSNSNSEKILASNYGDFYGVPALFPKKYFKTLSELKGDSGANKMLNEPSLSLISLKASEYILDIDTKEDYEKLIKNKNL